MLKVKNKLNLILTKVKRINYRIRPYLEKKAIIAKKDPTLIEEIKEAQKEWQEARNYFNIVSEPELVDYATYKIEAARVKYMYLLNKAKKRQ